MPPLTNPFKCLTTYLSSRRASKKEKCLVAQNRMANRGQETREEFLYKLMLVRRTHIPQEEVVLAKKEKKKGFAEGGVEEIIEIEGEGVEEPVGG